MYCTWNVTVNSSIASELSYESSDAIEEFTVTFQVQWVNSLAKGAEGQLEAENT